MVMNRQKLTFQKLSGLATAHLCWCLLTGVCLGIRLADREAVRLCIRQTRKARLPCLTCNQPPGWETKDRGLLQCRDKEGTISIPLNSQFFPRTFELCLERNEGNDKKVLLFATLPSVFRLMPVSELFQSDFAFPYMFWIIQNTEQRRLTFKSPVKFPGSS